MAIRGICSNGLLSPAIGVWIPNLFLIIATVYLFRRAANERSINFLEGFPFRWKRGN